MTASLLRIQPMHMGSLHAYEQVLTLVLAFGPFLVLGLVVWLRRRSDDAAAADDGSGPAGGQVVGADGVLGAQGLDQQVVDERLELAADQGDGHLDVESDGLGRHPR
jgi:hypothetical protein